MPLLMYAARSGGIFHALRRKKVPLKGLSPTFSPQTGMRNTSVFCLCNKNGGPSRYKGGFYMASYTQHYQLHQWEPSDDFLRSDFNDDFKKIDTAIKTTEQTLQTNFNGEVSRLDTALSAAQQTLQNNLNTQVTRLDTALSTAQQTLRNEFNGNLEKTNAALETVRALAAKKTEIVFGSYVGDGELYRTINLGFTIKWVFVYPAREDGLNSQSGLAAPGFPSQSEGSYFPVVVLGTTFQVCCEGSGGSFTNYPDKKYNYIAAK